MTEKFAEAEGAELYEIRPEKPYTHADLDWTDKKAEVQSKGRIWLKERQSFPLRLLTEVAGIKQM